MAVSHGQVTWGFLAAGLMSAPSEWYRVRWSVGQQGLGVIQSHDLERSSSRSSPPGLATARSLIYVRAPHASLVASAAAGFRHLVTPPLPFCENRRLQIPQPGLNSRPRQPPGSATSPWQRSQSCHSDPGKVRLERCPPEGSPLGAAPGWGTAAGNLVRAPRAGRPPAASPCPAAGVHTYVPSHCGRCW